MFWGTGMTALGLCALLGASAIGPSKGGEGGKLTKAQLDYSKKMFAEGDAAMKKGDYQTAYTKFADGYRYAPHLHAFTYNIAAAAEALGDCKIAKKYYQMFYDLVPEHPERGKVKKKLEGYKKTCMEDVESTEVVSTESSKARKEDRAKAEGDRAMNEVLFQLRIAQNAYKSGKERNKKKTKAFRAPARHKKWHAKRMAKLLASYEIAIDDRDVPQPEMPTDVKEACRAAKVQENRTLRALELAMEKFDAADAYRLMSRFVSVGERDLEKFEACS